MKTTGTRIAFIIIALGLSLCMMNLSGAKAQGRVLINEYMPWPSNGCGSTADFVELLNMGPGPMNIGGYIVTDGDYAITIPYGTIINPGQFFVLSGQSTLPTPCGNIAANVTVNLNWATCNCTSGTIPSTGDGFLTDGGAASEQVVLLNPTGGLVDAVVRTLPAETSSTITTKAGMGFPQVTFNLDLMSITYETIGQSAGRGNSFARRIDGACGWLKDTQQSAGATNNTPGAVNDLTFTIATTMNGDCLSGNAKISLTTTPASGYLPLDYILGYDANGDGQFTNADTYTTGTSNSASFTLSSLNLGNYSINIQPVQGCNSQTIPFVLTPCIILDFGIGQVKAVHTSNGFLLTAELSGANDVARITIEGGNGGKDFELLDSVAFINRSFTQTLRYNGTSSSHDCFRLCITDKSGRSRYSETVTLSALSTVTNHRVDVHPNPTNGALIIGYPSSVTETVLLKIATVTGTIAKEMRFQAGPGSNALELTLDGLPSGIYFLQIIGLTSGDRSEGRVIKR